MNSMYLLILLLSSVLVYASAKATTPTIKQTSTASPRLADGRPYTESNKNLPQSGRQEFPKLSSLSGTSLPSNSPTGPKSYANIAGGGSRPDAPTSPTPPPRNPSPTPNRATQNPSGSNRPAVELSSYFGATKSNSGQVNPSDPTYSKGKIVTDEDLEKLSEALFINDVNNANQFITINLQKKTYSSSSADEAPQPLLQVKPEALQIPTIKKMLSIYDNYKLDTGENENINQAQRQEENLLIDTFFNTNVMSMAMRFLVGKGILREDVSVQKDMLRTIWFSLYSRGQHKIGSTGFEHVFLTEVKFGIQVSGLHNWIYFNVEEVKNRLNYLGYMKKVDLGDKAAIVKTHVKFNGIDKPVTNIFIGTSPELEMALYTVCFYVRPDAQCPVSLGGTKFNIITHKFRYRGKDLIGSAYPEI